jgi:glycosyltransferase involved in cell wall biosynthesis
MTFRVAYFVTHPIQYQAPLLRYLAQAGGIEIEVFFLSDFSLGDHFERAFEKTFKWDIGLADGYRWEVWPRSWSRSIAPKGRWWPLAGLRARLRAGRFDAVWVHGWGNLVLCQVIDAARALHLPVLLRGESAAPFDRGGHLRGRLRGPFYRHWLLPRAAAFLAIGSRNQDFYRELGVGEERLFAMPYAVDNAFFQSRSAAATPARESLRQALGLAPDRPVILFVGKLIPAKAPEELLRAFARAHRRFRADRAPYLLYVGDGPLRATLEREAPSLAQSIRFLGFRNQTELPALYDLCDLFVCPSRFEPWGLVVNEAMNAARPVIVSDHVGASEDLVVDGVNGFVYRSGDVAELEVRLLQLLQSRHLRARMGERSIKRITAWDFAADRRGLLAALRWVCQKSSAAAISR